MTVCFGENLKALRLKGELTQEKLADFLGVSFQSVSKWERGECYPDITLLPQIASFFDTSIDDLLGVNEIKKREEISFYIGEFERLFYVDTPECFEKMKKAVKEFPNEYGLLVRYMSVLHSQAEDYESVTEELERVFDKIQNNCTDDGVRIWSKRILINHYRCRNNREYDLKAVKLSEDLPSVNDCKEYVSSYVFRPMGNGKDPFYTSDETHLRACQNSVEAAVTMLCNSITNYCLYDDAFSHGERIKAIEDCVMILKNFYTDGYYGVNSLMPVYFYGHLSYISFLNGDEKKALEYLDICAVEAKRLDEAPDEIISNSLYFRGKTLEKPKRGKTACERMKNYALNCYPYSQEFKNKPEFKAIAAKFG
ncbi:MAG: helix-turn-helix transcriptional regulator [Clostridiaceae bacterium]|nr:helix-turn-helix transcriptional regulator [Clostridiaceae bacterium]